MGGTTAGTSRLRKEKGRSKGTLAFPEIWARKPVVINGVGYRIKEWRNPTILREKRPPVSRSKTKEEEEKMDGKISKRWRTQRLSWGLFCLLIFKCTK